MTRVRVIGRWVEVLAAVVAWLLLVPLVEAVRALAGRLRSRRGSLPRVTEMTPPRRPVPSERRGHA